MRKNFLPFSKPDIDEHDVAAVAGVLRSGWITTGPKCAQLEEDFKAYTGCREAVAMTSETGVMEVLLRALGIGPGDEVITPAMTWVSMPNITTLAGARPVFVDVDKDTLMVDAAAVERAITPRTKLIVPVHFAGAALRLDELRAVAVRHGIRLVEDAAHALGAEFAGTRIGASGTAMFSFHPIKNITTGEGGMLATDDAALAARARSLKFHGLGVDAYDRQTHGRAPQAQVVEPGFKYNLPDTLAVLGVTQLAKLERMNHERRLLAEAYTRRLAEVPELMPLKLPEYAMKSSYHLYVVRLDIAKAGMSRDEFMSALKTQNIGTGLHFRCVHLQRYYQEAFGCKPGMLPATEWNSERILSLPMFPGMTDEDIDDVVVAAKTVLASGHRL